ncbi:substrate binding domain-containing protein, partial [Klebsiella oxytoca]
RAVVPTEAGRLFAEHARGISEQFSAARRDLQDRSLEPGGLVRINAPVYFGQRHIAPWLPGLSERYPQMQIELALTDDFIDPHREATDVIFRIGSLPDSSVHARVLGMQHHYLVAAPRYLQRRGVPQRPEDLRQHSTLVYSGSNGPNRWLFRLAEGEWVHYPQTPQLASNNADALLTAALGGMGVVLFPDWMVNEAIGAGRLIHLMPHFTAAISSTPSPVSAIYPHARHPSLNVRTVIDYFVDVFGTPLYWQR